LSDRQRAVVVLRYFADASDAEVAQLLGCRTSTVRSLARRSLLKLRKELS
jgi:RNA polymerase sigma factor (sigma-70 family)